MVRFYLHDNGSYAVGGGQPGTFQQSIQHLMACAERAHRATAVDNLYDLQWQVIPARGAADRHGLQSEMNLTAS